MSIKGKKEGKEKPEIDFEIGGKGLLGGFFQGLSKLIDLADKVTQEGGEIKKGGSFGVKGQKDMTGVYGFTIRTMAGPGGIPRPVVKPFGDIAKVKRTERTERPKGPMVEETREPLVDIFDEGEFVRLVTELPGVAESEISCELQGNDVIQIATKGKKKYAKEILLSSMVDPASLAKSYTNGILEVKLKKSVIPLKGEQKKGKK